MKELNTENRLLSNFSPEEIRKIIVKYPYFTVGRIIELLAAKKQSNPEFSSLLRESSAHITDRGYFYSLINAEAEKDSLKVNDMTGIKVEFSSSDEKLNPISGLSEILSLEEDKNGAISGSEAAPEILPEPDLLDFSGTKKLNPLEEVKQERINPEKIKEDSENQAFVTWIRELDNVNDTPDSTPGKNQLIDKFISEGYGSIRADREIYLKGDISKNSIEESEEFITDTLAKIYIKQGLYSKAIFSYESLSLKYPEKSTYFASQIEEIMRLITKNK